MSIYALWGALEIGLIFALVALGVLISFRMLRFPDLTVDGSFPLGGAVAATLIGMGMDPFQSTILATLAGALAGMITGWLNVKLKIMDLLASILMMIALYSINLRVMGRPNVPLIMEPTVFTLLRPDGMPDYVARAVILLVVVVLAKLLMDWFFSTQVGLAIRATGANPTMARAQGVHTGAMTLLGMALANALVGLAGALFAQTQGGSDISMGVGTIVVGLAAVIVGESLLPSRRMALATLAGATRLAAQSSEPPAALREQVTSKGGTTAAALAVFDSEDFTGMTTRAIAAAAQRARELSAVFGT